MPHRTIGVKGRTLGRSASVSDLKPHNIAISPTFGTDAGGTAVTINGTNIVADSLAVTIGGASCTSVVFVDATTMTCVTPSGTAGARDVVLTTVHGSDTQTGGFTYTVAGAIPSDALFFSDWVTGTGTGDAAVRDTDKTVSWTTATNNNGQRTDTGPQLSVETNTLFPNQDFTNNYRCNAYGVFSKVFLTGLALPAVNDDRYYRFYLYSDVANGEDSFGSGGHHPVQGQVNNSSTRIFSVKWGHTNGSSEMVDFHIHIPGNSWPNNKWIVGPVNYRTVYRLELHFQRTGTGTANLEARMYDGSDILIYVPIDFHNINSTDDLASRPTTLYGLEEQWGGFDMGVNGGLEAIGNPAIDGINRFGGAAVRTVDWCSSYANGF